MNGEAARKEEATERRPGRYVFQGREVTLPVEVRDASSGAVTYLVSARAARALLPGPELDVVEVLPGQALFSIAIIDYRDNDLGDYDEVSLAFFVRRRGEQPALGIPYIGSAIELFRSSLATWIWKLPVNQSFTRDAGEGIWGFPKTVEQIEFEDAGGRRTCRLVMDGKHVLTLSVPRGGSRTLGETTLSTYSYIDGVLHRTRFKATASGVGFTLGGADLILGTHPIADELRKLGLPRTALMSVWMERQRALFEGPERV
ncbi:MAG TPA: acetoacetate decarboxylase family protein [Candidatus Binatia bacterium]